MNELFLLIRIFAIKNLHYNSNEESLGKIADNN